MEKNHILAGTKIMYTSMAAQPSISQGEIHNILCHITKVKTLVKIQEMSGCHLDIE